MALLGMDELADVLTARCAPLAFGVPGGGPTLRLIDHLERRGVSFVTTYFEGSGALMAGAVGRVTGRPGICLSIKGPGLANMAAGLATCRLECLPVVGVCEAYDNGVPSTSGHKRIDQQGFARSVAKKSTNLSAGITSLCDTIDLATVETPGPVLIELASSAASPEVQLSVPILKNSEVMLSLIDPAKRPVVIAGSLAIRLGLSSHLNRLRVPVFTTAAAKGVVDESLPHAAGVYTGVGLDLAPERTILAAADLVIGVGLRAGEVLSFAPITCPAVMIDAIQPEHSGDAVTPVTAAALPDLWSALEGRAWGEELVHGAQESLTAHLMAQPFLPARCYRAVNRQFGGACRIVLDTGYFCTIGEHVARVTDPSRYLSSGMGRSMGAALPMAVAAALHDRDLPTILAVGDGGIGMFFSELRLAVAAAAPLLVILMSDGGFGSIRAAARLTGLTEKPLIMSQPGWRSACEGIGMWSAEATDETSFADVLAAWSSHRQPGMISVSFEPNVYRDMTARIRS
jgi:acetolactate synthase-1/2/3 large subunit